MVLRSRSWASFALLVVACGGGSLPGPPEVPVSPSPTAQGTFGADLAFLRKHGDVILLSSPSGGRVVVSPRYQGRVMTSAVSEGGDSLGWIHKDFIASGKTGTAFDNYGGEDRFWLGPEGGQYALYFAPGKPFTFDAWQTPSAFQEGEWSVTERSPGSISLSHPMVLSNHAGTTFRMDVARQVRVLEAQDITARLSVSPGDRVRWVAFETVNRITNTGPAAWTEDRGLPSIWILGMFAPAPDAKVIAPFERAGTGPIVNDAYFGKVPPERLQVREQEGLLVFTCDGKYRSKIGLGPSRARPVAGSYSASSRLLTIVQYDRPAGVTRYVNSMWEMQKEPYGGDVLNSYNDGPPAAGKPSLGGFYELETSSPAAALAPGGSLVHAHRTFHFVGEQADLSPIAARVLGVSLAALR